MVVELEVELASPQGPPGEAKGPEGQKLSGAVAVESEGGLEVVLAAEQRPPVLEQELGAAAYSPVLVAWETPVQPAACPLALEARKPP